MTELIVAREQGLWCEPGRFFVDPWLPVERALITHAHGDHARAGSNRYLAAREGGQVLRARLGDVALETLDWGERIDVNGVRVSFHPAGHVLGAAQIRLEHGGEAWVVSGDYRLEADRSCSAFEPVRCDVFVTESTFALPIYRWRPQREVIDELLRWWSQNAEVSRASVLFCHALGKAQRILAALADAAGEALPGVVVCHGAVESMNRAYRASGVALPGTFAAGDVERASLRRALVLAPPWAARSPWLRRFGSASDALASGWMQVRGTRRRRAIDRGFVLSDHADWPGLNAAIDATGAARVVATHGYADALVRWLRERGLDASRFATRYGDEDEGGEAEEARGKGEGQATASADEGDIPSTSGDEERDAG
ncbi:MAG: ligase-associated DNA damage response exonuclease [Burkholderiales bacterium]|nr:MAG: ligase-associated DNA damage response exonuclease [Burkholderiales bacterium]